MKIKKIYETVLEECKIGDFIIEDNEDIIEIYDQEENSVCWFDKSDLPFLINFLKRHENK